MERARWIPATVAGPLVTVSAASIGLWLALALWPRDGRPPENCAAAAPPASADPGGAPAPDTHAAMPPPELPSQAQPIGSGLPASRRVDRWLDDFVEPGERDVAPGVLLAMRALVMHWNERDCEALGALAARPFFVSRVEADGFGAPAERWCADWRAYHRHIARCAAFAAASGGASFVCLFEGESAGERRRWWEDADARDFTAWGFAARPGGWRRTSYGR